MSNACRNSLPPNGSQSTRPLPSTPRMVATPATSCLHEQGTVLSRLDTSETEKYPPRTPVRVNTRIDTGQAREVASQQAPR